MARFGQGLIQGLTQPSFGQGLFNLGGQIAERRRERQQLDAISGITSVSNQGMAAAQAADLGGLNASIKALQQQVESAPTIEVANAINKQITTLQGMVPETKKMASLNSVNQLEVARQAAKTPEQKREIERIMERVARESGNSTEGILGRTDTEIQTGKTRVEGQIRETFYAIPADKRKEYIRGIEQNGFGEIASILEARELEREADQIKIDEARTNAELARTPLPTGGLKKRIESLPDSQEKTDLLDRIEAAESRNIKEGQTFMPGERKRLGDELTSINDGISRAAGRQDQANLIVERQTQDEIQRLQRDLTRIEIDDDQVEEEARRLEKEKGTDFVGLGTTYKDFEAEARENLEQEAAAKIQAAIDRLQGSSTPDDSPNESQDAGQSVIEGWSASDYKGKTVTFKDGTYKSDGTKWTKVG
jgi:hypothetical protein